MFVMFPRFRVRLCMLPSRVLGELMASRTGSRGQAFPFFCKPVLSRTVYAGFRQRVDTERS